MHPTTLSNRERLVRTLCGRPTDRAPFPYWLGFVPWGQTIERWRVESGIVDLSEPVLRDYFGFEPFFQNVPMELGPFPPFASRVLEETEDFIVSVDGRGIRVRNRRDYGSMPEFLAHPVTCRADWERYKAERLAPRFAERLAHLDAFAEAAARIDAPVQVGAFPWGVFGTYRDLLGAEQCLLALYDDPALAHDMMTAWVDLWLELYARAAVRIQIDHVHIWEDMCGKQGSLISMEMVESFMMPHYDRLVSFARSHGVRVVSVDSDGRVDELVRVVTRHGVNAFLPFEVQAGNDVEAVRDEHPRLGLLGGLDKSALARGGTALDAELAKAERLLAKGGYVPGFDHLIPPDVPWAHYRYAVESLRGMVGL